MSRTSRPDGPVAAAQSSMGRVKAPPPSRWRCGASELCNLFASEWKLDASSLANDGQHWRSVFGGARLVLGTIRISPAAFVIMRFFLCLCMLTILIFETRLHPMDQDWMLTFGHWTLIVQCLFFGLATGLSMVAACQGGGGISRTAPSAVRITEYLYGALIPGAWVAFGIAVVNYSQRKHCISHLDALHAQPWMETVLSGSALFVVLLDTAFNRMPYYASFHGLTGLAYCWGYLLFNTLWQVLGGRNKYEQRYIYRCLDWYYPFSGGGFNAAGKLLYLNLFLAVPLFNFTYWTLIWARRRVMLIGKPASVPGERNPIKEPMLYANGVSSSSSGNGNGSKGGGAGAGPAAGVSMREGLSPLAPGRRRLFEWAADWRDLELDGRHWRAQFGGSSSARSPRVGAYVCCGAWSYCVSRFVIFLLSALLLLFRLISVYGRAAPGSTTPGPADVLLPGVHPHATRWFDFFLFLEDWVLLLAASYFGLAAYLTLMAVAYSGSEAVRTPKAVWAAWGLHGMLLPLSIANGFVYILLAQGRASHHEGGKGAAATAFFDLTTVYGTLALVLIDAWINRQPYYASFHALMGVVACWGYLLFNVLYVLGGGTDEYGRPYLYPAAAWRASTLEAWVHPGKLIFLEVMLFIPVANLLYWCMLWARRRARVAVKQSQV